MDCSLLQTQDGKASRRSMQRSASLCEFDWPKQGQGAAKGFGDANACSAHKSYIARIGGCMHAMRRVRPNSDLRRACDS